MRCFNNKFLKTSWEYVLSLKFLEYSVSFEKSLTFITKYVHFAVSFIAIKLHIRIKIQKYLSVSFEIISFKDRRVDNLAVGHMH